MMHARPRSRQPFTPEAEHRIDQRTVSLPVTALLTAVVAMLSLVASCTSDSSDPEGAPASSNPSTFSVPRKIVVSVAPYGTVEEALQDEQRIDWLRDEAAARAITLAYAAKELADHLALAGVPASLSADGSAPAESAIVLGIHDPGAPDTPAGPGGPKVAYDTLGDQGYAISPWQGRIYITANDRVGVLNGVYGFLDQLGFAWYDPYETHVPDQSSLAGPVSWRAIQEVPRVRLRGYWIYGDAQIPDEFAVWLARNRLNVGGRAKPFVHHRLGLKGWGGGHDLLQQEFSRPGLFEQHPEWYALFGGVRRPIQPSGTYFNPAFSSASAAVYFADRMIERLESGDLRDIDILNVWPTDDRFNLFDQSPEAIAVGNETDNLLTFYVNVGARFRQYVYVVTPFSVLLARIKSWGGRAMSERFRRRIPTPPSCPGLSGHPRDATSQERRGWPDKPTAMTVGGSVNWAERPSRASLAAEVTSADYSRRPRNAPLMERSPAPTPRSRRSS